MKIAFIGDQAGKVHQNRFNIFKKYIKEHTFDFITINDSRLKKKCRKCDAIYYASFTLYFNNPIKHNVILGSATSWKCIFDKRTSRVLKKLHRFTRLSANNLSLADELKKYRSDIYYLPNGVETDFFCPAEFEYNPKSIAIGWVGNKDRGEKNYYTILSNLRKNLKPAMNINMIKTKKSVRPSRLRTHAKMLKFYRKLTYYLVTSSYEGTPNPALEAAACGVPIITTRVGNMPELITEGVNGFFIKCHYKGAARKINRLRNISTENYYDLRRAIRSEIETNWTWEQAANRFSEFFKI